ncbi:MAG TPA: hypothetical protein PL063_05425 [Candidatus Cloacimonadota bacterium]|jgi:hypothetical protein|nr:hypothetical protein [Candidatus Cloacimonadota bacterium]HQB41695.1 hypothetical protein [Candidatus Cloacimonadota bacterium]
MKKIFLLFIISLSFFKIYAQADFDVAAFADTLKYNWTNTETRYAFRENLEFKKSLLKKYENETLSISLNIGKSMIMPGWGHMHTEDYLRGQILLSTEILLAGTSYFLYDKSMEKYDKYKKADQIDVLNQYYSEANTAYKQATMAFSLFALVWVYNVYDTYIVTEQYNDHLWVKNIQKELDKKITVTPLGISVKF